MSEPVSLEAIATGYPYPIRYGTTEEQARGICDNLATVLGVMGYPLTDATITDKDGNVTVLVP